VLQYYFTWKTLSVMAGITFWNFYFWLFPGGPSAVRRIIEFLGHMLLPVPLPLSRQGTVRQGHGQQQLEGPEGRGTFHGWLWI
jgi:hypothetical protein